MRVKLLPPESSRMAVFLAKPLILFAGLFCSLLLVSVMVFAQAKPNKTAADLAEAKALYASVCSSCHGLDAHGGERGPDIVTKPDVAQKTDGEIMDILQGGRPSAGMPAFASLGSEKLSGMVAYLRMLQGRNKQTALPGNPSRGESLFFGKAKCAECHSVSGRGGFLASDLTSYAARQGTDEIRSKIANPDKDLDPRQGMVEVVRLDGTQLSGVIRNEDNFSLQMQTPDGLFHLLNKSDIQTQTYTGKSGMPTNYGSTLSTVELNDIVSYLVQVSGSENVPKPRHNAGDSDE